MRIVITGGTGFIGTHLIQLFSGHGYDLHIISSSEDKKKTLESKFDCNVHIGSFGDEDWMTTILKKGDYVVHLAYSTVPENSVKDPVFDVESNVNASIRLLKACQKLEVQKFVFLSTGGVVYGIPESIPITESHSLNPISSYGITKVMIERLIPLFVKDFIILRVGNVYGTGHDAYRNQGVINIWLKNILQKKKIVIYGDGEIVRDYIYVKDLNDAILVSLGKINPGIYNLASGKGASLNDLLTCIRNVTKIDFETEFIPARNFDVPVNILSCEKFINETGWSSEVNLEQGIKIIWDSLLQHESDIVK